MKPLNRLAQEITRIRASKGFVTEWSNFLTKLMLVVTELGEATEAYRKGEIKHIGEELADAFIRLLDIVGALGIDIDKAIDEKMETNRQRPMLHGLVFNDKEFQDENLRNL